jgi:uncharacterized membrane protein
MLNERPPIVYVPPRLRRRTALAIGCHGNPDRCLTVLGWRMPVCARCIGLMAGNVVAALAFIVFGLPTMLIAAACLLPMIADGSAQALTRYQSTPFRRLSSGLLGGFGQLSLILALIGQLLPKG